MAAKSKFARALKARLPALLVCAAALAAMAPALFNGFVDWDDVQYVVANPALRGSWLDALAFFPGYYHPLTIFTYKLEFALFGLHPLPYHLTSLLLHAANGAAVLAFFTALGAAPLSAFVGALLFCVHPVHAEAVAWISGRKELLWGLFAFWSLNRYLRYADGGGKKYFYWSLLLFLLAALSKPAALTLPLVALLLDLYRGRKLSAAVLAEKAVFLLPAILIFALSSSREGFLLAAPGAAFSLPGAAAADINSALFYLWKFVLPRGLSALYPALMLRVGAGWYLASAAALAGAAALLVKRRGLALFRSRVSFGLLFFLVTLLPGLVVSPPTDRYLYVPAAGLCLVYGEFFAWLRETWRRRSAALGRAALLLAAAHLLTLALLSFSRASVWRDSLTLWNSVLAENPREPAAWFGRANAWRSAGLYPAAIIDYGRCLELQPDNWKALANRGRIKAEEKDFERALADYGAAIKLEPRSAQLFLNRGNAYFCSGKYRQALNDYSRALELAPGLARAAENRAAAEAALRR